MSATKVTTIADNGTLVEHTSRSEVEDVFLDNSREKYHQTEQTCPFMHSPLLDHFGALGDTMFADQVLMGTYEMIGSRGIPNDLNARTAATCATLS